MPWDDDFDVKINAFQKEVLKKALESVEGHTVLIREKKLETSGMIIFYIFE